MKSYISKQNSEHNLMSEYARIATLALTLTVIMVGFAYLLSAFKQMMFD